MLSRALERDRKLKETIAKLDKLYKITEMVRWGRRGRAVGFTYQIVVHCGMRVNLKGKKKTREIQPVPFTFR